MEIEWPEKIWVIGCGNMGGAILQAWLDRGLPEDHITIIKPNQTALPGGLQSQSDYPEGKIPDMVLLAMKPHQLAVVAEKLAPMVQDQTRLISVLAGTETEILQQAFPDAGSIVRLMPNMAVTVGKSPMLLFSDADSPALRIAMSNLFSSLGPPEWLNDEDQMHLATALAGSGPAFLFRFVDALAASAQELGMEAEQAARLALKMVEGAAELAANSDVSPGILADRVASPNGVTRKGLDVLDADGRVNLLMKDVLQAAANRNREMAEEAKA